MFLKVLFIAGLLIVYIMVAITLKPTSLHVKRPYSTATLKFSYLGYLAISMFFIFLFMFYNGNNVLYLEDNDNPRASLHFAIMLTALFLPNAGILLRRQIRKRYYYNVAFSIINVISALFYIFLIRKLL